MTATLTRVGSGTAMCSTGSEGAWPHEDRQLRYQPIIDLASMEVVGAEALSRFPRAEQSGRSVGAEVRALEKSGGIVEHGRWVLARSAFDWWTVASRGWRLSVNVSPVELNRAGYAEEVLRWFPRGGVALELTETSAAPILRTARRNLSQLAERGVPLVLDDLGDGHNSFRRMLALGCAQVKLSRRWTEGLGVDRRAERRLSNLLERIRGASRTVTLEGLETELQIRWARRHGCDRAQGFGLARPMGITALRAWRGVPRGVGASEADRVSRCDSAETRAGRTNC